MSRDIDRLVFDLEREVAILEINAMLLNQPSAYILALCRRMRGSFTEKSNPPHPILDTFEYHRDKVLDDIWDKLNDYDTELLEEFQETMSPEGLEVFCRMERPRLCR